MKKRRFLLFAMATVMAVGLASCKPKNYTVAFDAQNGSEVVEVLVKSGKLVEEPAEPSKTEAGVPMHFAGWYTTAEPAATDTPFNFNTKIKADTNLFAKWSDKLVVRFDTKTSATMNPVYLSPEGEDLAAPTAPTRAGFNFAGWYHGKPGQTWLEPEAVQFPLHVTKSLQLYAFWTPVNSKTASWSAGETYLNAFTELDADPILNPLDYHWAHENNLMGYLSTPLFGTDVNWDQAIEDGLADAKGDFSKLDEHNIGSLLRENVLYGAAGFPVAVGGEFDGEDGVDQHGKFSEAISREIMATTYRYTIRDDLLWEDGSQVTAEDYFYTYFQYIDQKQNNFRASSYYPTASRNSGLRVVNARKYFLQGTEVGMGETSANPLTGDYGYVQINRYLGEDNPLGPDYVGVWPFANPGSTIYLTEDEFNDLGLEIGNNQTYPEGIDFSAAQIAHYDFKADIKLNPYFIGPKGSLWPETTKEDVGFKVIDDHTFEMTFEVPTSHSSAMGAADFKLVHPLTYESSLNTERTNSTYGTHAKQPLSYGGYVISSWDSLSKIIFNKNYDSLMHKFYNYKSISYEFMPNVDFRMNAFKEGLLSVTGLNQTYYNDYLENPNRKDYYDGYPQYLMFNTVEYAGQNSAVVSAIQDKNFRQAFFFGFNRIEFATTIYAPNVPSLLVFSSNATQYDNDPSWYVNTPEYEAMLEDLGIDLSTYGYDSTKAKNLFNLAYDAWVAEGNSGPITLRYLTSEGAEAARIDDYVINHYTQLFGADKIKFVKDINNSDVASDKQDAFEFDITLTAVGTGTVTNLSVMLPIIGLKFQETYGAQFGFNTMEDLNIPEEALVIDEDNKLDLRATWNYLKTVTDRFDEETDGGTLWPLWQILQANSGYFVGNLDVLFEFGLECTFIWAGLAPQYDGDVEDRNTVTRAFDRIILEYAPLIPTVGRASSIVYAPNVVNVWPAYHNIMEWGQSRYWYLNTDPDFQN